MHQENHKQHGYPAASLLVAALLAAYALAGYLDQRDAHPEQHHSQEKKQ